MASAEQPPGDAVPITSLGAQHLAKLRENLQEDVETLAEQHGMLGRLAARSSASGRAVETLADSKTGAGQGGGSCCCCCCAKCTHSRAARQRAHHGFSAPLLVHVRNACAAAAPALRLQTSRCCCRSRRRCT